MSAVQMKVGLLWFDDDPQRKLEEKVLRAARHYQRKFGLPPNICYVHPKTLDGSSLNLKALKVQLITANDVLPDHFWIGVGTQE